MVYSSTYYSSNIGPHGCIVTHSFIKKINKKMLKQIYNAVGAACVDTLCTVRAVSDILMLNTSCVSSPCRKCERESWCLESMIAWLFRSDLRSPRDGCFFLVLLQAMFMRVIHLTTADRQRRSPWSSAHSAPELSVFSIVKHPAVLLSVKKKLLN